MGSTGSEIPNERIMLKRSTLSSTTSRIEPATRTDRMKKRTTNRGTARFNFGCEGTIAALVVVDMTSVFIGEGGASMWLCSFIDTCWFSSTIDRSSIDRAPSSNWPPSSNICCRSRNCTARHARLGCQWNICRYVRSAIASFKAFSFSFASCLCSFKVSLAWYRLVLSSSFSSSCLVVCVCQKKKRM